MANGRPPEAYPLGPVTPAPAGDPAAAPPRDPLGSGKPTRMILRDIPIPTIQTSWTVAAVRAALATLPSGQFSMPAQLVDAIVGDDRVQSAMSSRTSGLTSQPIKFSASTIPGVDEDAAKDCLRAWKQVWPKTMSEPVLSELLQWSVMMGFCPAQLVWDTTVFPQVPYVRVFHPRYSYYHWTLRAFVAITQDGAQAITPGDAHWILHAPHGEYRGWMRGAVRGIAQPWLGRNLAVRDHLRWSELHGFPKVIGETPAAADDIDKTRWLTQLATLGQESVIEAPKGVDDKNSYGVDLLEAKDGAWQGFSQLVQQCDMAITLALLGQNLTSQVGNEGSFAAARVHADVRQAIVQSDARALSATIYNQIARPFALVNFGDPNLAPMTEWDPVPLEDREAAAKVMADFGQAVQAFRRGGVKFTALPKIARSLGILIDDDDFEEVEPVASSGAGGGGFGK